MAAPADKFSGWIDSLSVKWKDRLKGWAASFIGLGIEVFMDVLGKKSSTLFQPLLSKIESTGEIPPELKPILDELKNPSGEAAALLFNRMAGGLTGSALSRVINTFLNPLSYNLMRLMPSELPGPAEGIELWMRKLIDDHSFDYILGSHGFNGVNRELLKQLHKLILPSEVVAPAWLRDKAKYEHLWEEVKKLGISQEQVDLFKEMAYRMPTPQDIVTWLAREVFEPSMIEKYGLDDEWETVDKSLFEKVGLRESMALNYWRAHWQHPQYNDVRRLLHRGQITEEDVFHWFRVVEIPPLWRKGLTALMWDVPGRVELRMMAQYGLIDKAYAMDILKKDGLGEEYRSVVADMMIVRGIRTDLQTRYAKKWLDAAGVKAEIEKAGLSPAIGERLYQWIVANTKGDRTAAEKDLTVAQITKAVRRGDIPWNDGITRLMALRYDEEEADLIMMQSVEVVEEEPTTELNVRVDTIRRQRRQRLITRDQEISSLIRLGIDTGLATAYADNDDLRLAKATTESE